MLKELLPNIYTMQFIYIYINNGTNEDPEVHFIVYVQYTFTLQEMEEFVVNISQSHVTPEPLNSLVMSAPASDGTASSRSPENDHNTERIVFSSMIHIWPRRLSSNALQYCCGCC